MSPRRSHPKAVHARAAALGVEVDELDGFICIDAPVGVVFVGNGEHCFTTAEEGSRPEMWGDALDFLRMGVAPCPAGSGCRGLEGDCGAILEVAR